MKTTLVSISLKQYLAHEWSVKDAVDKGASMEAKPPSRTSGARDRGLSYSVRSVLVF